MGKKTKLREVEILQKEQNLQQLIQKGKYHRNPVNILTDIYQNWRNATNFPVTSHYFGIANRMNSMISEKKTRQRKAFYELLLVLAKKRADRMFIDEHLVRTLFYISAYMERAVRDIQNWKMPCHNPYRSLGHLIRYLFAEYETPTFMDNAFYEGNHTHIIWYLQLGLGRSLRKYTEMPIPLSAKGMHLFLNAPPKYKINEAMRYSQVLSMGGDEKLVAHLLGTFLAEPSQNEAFWETVIRFFVQNPMLDPVHIAPIIDCIRHKKFAPVNPEMPNFEMKGRSVAALLRLVEDWHNQLNWAQKGRIGKKDEIFWTKFNIADFVHYEGKIVEGMKTFNGEAVSDKMYRITQLMSANELLAEGQAMSHCVASYSQSCKAGNTSIWSFTLMTKENLVQEKRLLTIELSKSKVIVQVRGKYNARANENEMLIIRKWAAKEGLQLSSWI